MKHLLDTVIDYFKANEEVAKVDFKDATFYIDLLGLNPMSDASLIMVICSPFHLLYLIVHIMEMAEENWSLEAISLHSNVILVQIQIIGKVIMLVINKKKIRLLMQSMENLTSLEDVDQKDLEYIYQPHKIFKIVFRVYKVFLVANAFSILLVPRFLIGRFGVRVYHEDKEEDTEFFLTQFCIVFFHMFYSIFVFFGSDGILFYLNAHIIGELRTVKRMFENAYVVDDGIEDETVLKKFNLAAKYHARILESMEIMSKAYNGYFLIQYLGGLTASTLGVAINGLDTTDILEVLVSLIYIIIILFPIGMYSYLGNILYEESLMSDAIFYRDWSKSVSFKNKLGTIMSTQKGQIGKVLQIGSFAPLNLQSYTQLIKMCLSVITFLNKMQSINNSK